jgi:hypothetical protein
MTVSPGGQFREASARAWRRSGEAAVVAKPRRRSAKRIRYAVKPFVVGRAEPDRALWAHVVAQCGPERGEPGPKQVVAKERIRPAAGAPGRIHERHATLR